MPKSKTVNGAATRTAKTSTDLITDKMKRDVLALPMDARVRVAKRLDTIAREIAPSDHDQGHKDWIAELKAKREAQVERARDAYEEMTVKVCAGSYGILAEAAVVHKITVEEALDAWINDGDMLTEWSNQGFQL